MTIEQVKELLKHYGIQPRREQGQNFLLDNSVITAAIQAAEISKEDTVLEIGPGFGALTQALCDTAGTVVAVEQDTVLASGIKKLAKIHPNLTVINEDVRTTHLEAQGLTDFQYKLVANLPYNITSWVVRHFLESVPRPKTLTMLIQLEVAQRMLAPRGSMSVLSVATQLYAAGEIVLQVPPESFYPAPKVQSAIIHLKLHQTPLSADPEGMMRLVNIGFASRRKQLHNNLSTGLQIPAEESKAIIASVNLKPTVRPQELSIQDWENIRIAVTKAQSAHAAATKQVQK